MQQDREQCNRLPDAAEKREGTMAANDGGAAAPTEMPRKRRVADSYTEQVHILMHSDINGQNRLFGGQLLKWIDEVAGVTARRHCGRNVTTAAIDQLSFKDGAFLNETVVLAGRVTYVGHTSIEVRVDTYREDEAGMRYLINHAYLVMVCMGEDGKPIPTPGLLLETEGEQIEWENGKKRRDLRLVRRKEGY